MVHDVIGRERYGQFVLFGLGDGVYAAVTKSGDITLSIGWVQMTKFVTIDPRGVEAVPSDELRKAISVLKSYLNMEEVEELKREAKKSPKDVEFYEAAQMKYCEAVSRLPVNPDGSIRWCE